MQTNRRGFLRASAAASLAEMLARPGRSLPPAADTLQALEIAKRNSFVAELPTPSFFQGMLLGNGDVGVCVTVRPDALGLHLGKNDCWDIRVSDDYYYHYALPFDVYLEVWKQASEKAKQRGEPEKQHLEFDPEFLKLYEQATEKLGRLRESESNRYEDSADAVRRYQEDVEPSYLKLWPRPWPCGIVWVHWDSRWITLIRQSLDPSDGLLEVELRYQHPKQPPRRIELLCFVDWATGLVSVSTDVTAPFLSVAYYPHLDQQAQLPAPQVGAERSAQHCDFTCYQSLPALAPTPEVPQPPRSPDDRAFALRGRVRGAWMVEGQPRSAVNNDHPQESSVILRSTSEQPFRMDLAIWTGRDQQQGNRVHLESSESAGPSAALQTLARLSSLPVSEIQQSSQKHWREFWSRSAVEFEDRELERIWYHNQYFLACCLRPGKIAPGLFANWMSGEIGTAWHGDYHLDYNAEQVYWGVFSSNHAEQHLPYLEFCEHFLPIAEAYAKDKFGLPGAYYPLIAYPAIAATRHPTVIPPYDLQISNSPWAVQSVWWHYLYTRDEAILSRVYPILRAVSRFLVAYVKKGPDGKYHFEPTVSPENWGLTVDFRLNKDCIIDLALTRFILDAAVEASKLLDADAEERPQWTEVSSNLAPYPKAHGPFGEVWVDVLNAPTEYVYNVPVTLAPVFPGEQVGIGRNEERLEIAKRTAETVRLEGGNDLVFQPLVRARLGMLDFDWFKREVCYCLLPNGVANDRVRQVEGRYADSTDYDHMMHMGFWTENFSLPAVLNECLLQSYTGTIHLFPNARGLGAARFQNLRAAGGFLVSASHDGESVSSVTLLSEKGLPARLPIPGAVEAPA